MGSRRAPGTSGSIEELRRARRTKIAHAGRGIRRTRQMRLWNRRSWRSAMHIRCGTHARSAACCRTGENSLRQQARSVRCSRGTAGSAKRRARRPSRGTASSTRHRTIRRKGFIETGQGRCYPLTMLDDHSRFAQILKACTNERTETVKAHLIESFRRFGLPRQMSMDNGNPWGTPWGDRHTHLTAWLIRLGVRVSHARPLHPQTNGKEERFHRTLKAELLGTRWFSTLDELQREFDRWRGIYKHERPHEAIGLEVPASRYVASPRSYPEQLPPIVYDSTDIVRK